MINSFIKRIDRKFGIESAHGHTFYGAAINPTSKVIDLGACKGEFSQFIAAQYGCTVFALEPSPELFSIITETPSIHKYNYAIAGNDGFATFYPSNLETAGNIIAPKSNSTGNTIEIETRKFSSFLQDIGLKEIDLLKIDIEGAEQLLFDTAAANDIYAVKQMSIEFHDSVNIPNISTKEVRKIIQKIHDAGFLGIALGVKNSNWLFINRVRLMIPLWVKIYLFMRHIFRFGIGKVI